MSTTTELTHPFSKRRRCAGIIAPLLFFFGCASEQEKKSFEEIRALFNASGCSATYGMEASTSNGSGRYVELSLSGVPALDQYRSLDFVTSRAAYLYYGGMDAEQRAKYDQIRVEVDGGGTSYTKSYAVSDMPDFGMANELVEAYLASLTAGDYHAQDGSLDRGYLPDSAMAVVNDTYAMIDSAQGPFVSSAVVGYEAANTSDGVPLLMVYADAAVRDSVIYNFTFAMNRQNKKLAKIAFE